MVNSRGARPLFFDKPAQGCCKRLCMFIHSNNTPGSILAWTTLQIFYWMSGILTFVTLPPPPKSVLSTLEKYELFTQIQSLTAISLFIIPQRHLLSGLFRYCTFQTLFLNVYIMYCFTWVTMATQCLYIVL